MKPITTIEQLSKLDDDEMVLGYKAGFDGRPNYTKTNQSYWHGFMNGEVDSGRAKTSIEQQELARVFIASGSLTAMFATRQ